MPKAFLTPKSPNENGEGVIRFSKIRSINLAGVASKNHFGALTNSRQYRFQRGGFKVLRFVDYHYLSVQGSSAQECHRFE